MSFGKKKSICIAHCKRMIGDDSLISLIFSYKQMHLLVSESKVYLLRKHLQHDFGGIVKEIQGPQYLYWQHCFKEQTTKEIKTW